MTCGRPTARATTLAGDYNRSMYSVLMVLLVSALATVGFMALWASESPRHWFLRMAVFFAALAPLLLVPAYEPFVALALQGGVVAAGVQAARRLARRKRLGETPEATATSRRQFSLATLLLAMVLCGVAAAVFARLPALNWYAWQSVAVVGVGGGLATLLGRAATAVSGRQRIAMAVLACLMSMLVGLIVARFDWFADSFEWTSWPPEPSALPPGFSTFADFESVSVIWIVVLPFVTWLTTLMYAFSPAWRALPPLPARAVVKRIASVALAVVIAAPAAVVLYKLLTPEPIPGVTLPQPNAFDEFVAAGESLSAALVNSGNFDHDTAPRREVAKAAAEVAPAVARARKAFQHESQAPLDYNDGSLTRSMSNIQSVRSLGRAFSVVGKLAALDRKPEEALAAHLDNVRLGFESRRGGLLVDGIVGCAVSGIGYWGLYECRELLSPAQCREAIEQIQHWLDASEPFEAFWRRDRVWSQYANGWHGRLYQVLDDVGGGGLPALIEAFLPLGYEQPFNTEKVKARLLVAQLALDAYVAEHEAPPVAWYDVEQAGWPPLGADPYDPADGKLRYKLMNGDPVIYSVGPNGVDEDGAPPGDDDWNAAESGDLRADRVFTN